MEEKKDDGNHSDIYERVIKTLKSLTETDVPKIPGGYKTSNNMNHNSIQSATEDLSCAYILKILESNLRRREAIEKYQVKFEQIVQLRNRLANLPESICAFLNIGNVMAFYKELTCHPPFTVDLKNLTCLDFVRAKIKSIPKDIDYFDKLIHMNVCGNGLSSLPATIGNLSKLESLDISLNELTTIPETFGNLVNLRFFDAHCNELNSIPECIGKLKNLIELDLSQNYIDNIPETCGNLLKLRRFDVSYNNLTTLPQTIGNMNGLTELEMSRSKLKSIPESKTIGNLSSLAFLRAICNQLINLPDTIGDMINLSSLELSRNNLTSIPEAIGNLINLENLDVSDNQITELPKTLWNLKKLKQLDVACNKLSSISEEIGNLTNLESLIVNHNQITNLPSSVGELKRLKFLRIHCNDLSAIPETIGNLENLIRLNADANNIATVPTTIGKLQKLELLYLSSNSIRCIPKEISDCKNLREINFDDNIYLESVPVRMTNLPNLLFLSVDRCKLRCLPALLSPQLKEVRVFKNTQITHIPIIYEKFFDDYDNIEVFKRDRFNPSYFNIKEEENGSYLLLPFGTKKVFNIKENIPFSLLELALQAACKLPDNEIVRNMINYLPYTLKELIEKGPIAQCSYVECDKKLCTEYFLLIVKRLQHESELLFSCNFCSITCTVQWLECNERKYNVVEWKVVQ